MSGDGNRMRVAFYDTKPYDREYFAKAADATGLETVFHEFRLCAANAASAEGASVACVFVNDKVDRECLGLLAGRGVRMVTSHQAFLTEEALTAIAETTVDSVLRFLEGREAVPERVLA